MGKIAVTSNKTTESDMTLSKHARERYRARFGIQDDKEIIRRCSVGIQTSVSRDGFAHRVYGAILFVTANEIIITVKNIHDNPFSRKQHKAT